MAALPPTPNNNKMYYLLGPDSARFKLRYSPLHMWYHHIIINETRMTLIWMNITVVGLTEWSWAVGSSRRHLLTITIYTPTLLTTHTALQWSVYACTHMELHTTERELEIRRHVADTHLNLPSSAHWGTLPCCLATASLLNSSHGLRLSDCRLYSE